MTRAETGQGADAHHFGNAHRALVDTIALSDAVRVALQQVDLDDTLVVVTADHSHVLSFAGYPMRGNPILGQVRGVSGEDAPGGPNAVDSLGLPYTTLSDANGPGYTGASNRQPEGTKRHRREFSEMDAIRAGRPDLRAVDPTDPDFLQEATVPLKDETHGGEDVPMYATGAGAEAFRGSLERRPATGPTRLMPARGREPVRFIQVARWRARLFRSAWCPPADLRPVYPDAGEPNATTRKRLSSRPLSAAKASRP